MTTIKYARIIETRGNRYPGQIERIYRLRSGRQGRGVYLAEHRARGDYRATDAAIADLTAQATRLGYTLIETA